MKAAKEVKFGTKVA